MFNTNKNIYKCLLPNLLSIQRASYCWFLEKGLIQELDSFSVVRDYVGGLELNFVTMDRFAAMLILLGFLAVRLSKMINAV